MIEKLEEYGRFLFGWAFRAMQSEITMQESLNAKSERAYLTGTEIALLEDSSLFIIGIGILVLMEAFFVVVIISLLLHGVMKLIRLCLAKGYSMSHKEKGDPGSVQRPGGSKSARKRFFYNTFWNLKKGQKRCRMC